MTDLHTHILPAVDDGADSIETALHILRKQKECGIERVALTPHFYPTHEELDAFLDRRQQAYNTLLTYWDSNTMPQMCLGAEVRYTPALLQLDLHRLTIGEGRYLLLELPDAGVAVYVEQVVEEILEQGVIPVLAHVERCLPFRDEPIRLQKIIQMGGLAQISSRALINKGDRFAVACLRNGLAQLVSSDIHKISEREYFFDAVASEKNLELIKYAENFAKAIWENAFVPAFSIKPIRRGLFGYCRMQDSHRDT